MSDAFACECGATLFLQANQWSTLRPGTVMLMAQDDEPTLHLQCAACRTIYALVNGEFQAVWRTIEPVEERG